VTLRVLIGERPYRLHQAFEECGGKLACRGQHGQAAEVVDFRAMPEPRAAFLERLWWDGQDETSSSATLEGTPVRLGQAQ
jgi:hypothetical protein